MDQNTNAKLTDTVQEKRYRIWLMLSILSVVCGAFLLFPIGGCVFNTLFILIKIGMLSGLIILLCHHPYGFCAWGSFCIGAVIMTILKWVSAGQPVPLFIAAILTDILMPAIALHLYRKISLPS